MPGDSAGKLSVRYEIVSSKAEAALKRISAKLKQVEDYAIKSGKTIGKAMKAGAVAFAAFGAVAVGVLYAIIRGSSYASIYTDQFSMSMTRLYDHILEVTGLGEAIETFLEKFDKFVDILTTEGLKAWIDDLSTFDSLLLTIIIGLGIAAVIIAAVIAAGLLFAGVTAVLAPVVAGLATLGITIAALPLLIGIVVGAVLGMLVVWVLWKTGVLEVIYDLGARFGEWVSDIYSKFRMGIWKMKTRFATWVTNTKEKLSNFKTWVGEKFDALWTYIITGLTTMKDDFFGIIDKIITKVSDLITKILSIPSSFGGGDGGGVYTSTSSTQRSSGWATGAHFNKSATVGVHAGEDLVRLKSLLSGIRTDQAGGATSQAVTNNITVNVTGATGNTFENRDLANVISRKISAEVSRIGTGI